MTSRNRCRYFNGMERGVDKFLQILKEIVLFVIITAIISVGFWYAMTAIATWMEVRGF